jgi:lysophosphatidate acyltransferase
MKLVISFLPLGVFLFHHSRVFRFITRALLVILGIAVTSVYGVLATIFLSFYGRGEDSTVATARFVTTFFTPLLGMTCTVEGQEYLHGERPCVFICNHQSSLDMIMM